MNAETPREARESSPQKNRPILGIKANDNRGGNVRPLTRAKAAQLRSLLADALDREEGRKA